MLKKIISSALALCMVFGAAAYLPEGAAVKSAITAKAETYGDYEYTVLDDGTVKIKKYLGTDSVVRIPSTIDGKKVTEIGTLAFLYRSPQEIVIPATVTKLEYMSFLFSWTSKISVDSANKSFTVSDGVLYSKDKKSLIAIPEEMTGRLSVPKGVTDISLHAIMYANKLEGVDVESGNKNYFSYDGALYDADKTHLLICPGGKSSVKIYKGIKVIDDSAFFNCTKLTSITVPEGTKEIYDHAFSYCSSLTELKLPDSIRYVSNWTFDNCPLADKMTHDIDYIDGVAVHCKKNIVNADFKEGTRIIALSGSYEKLKTISIPDSVKYIGDESFDSCYNITSVSVGSGVKELNDRIFKEYKKLSKVTLSEGLERIGEDAFRGCTSLKKIDIPDSVTDICDNAFRECTNLSSVKLGKGLKNVGYAAFYLCPKVKSITIPKNVKKITPFAFGYSYICPFGYHERYKDFTLKCSTGSKGEKYAKKNEIKYYLTDGYDVSKAEIIVQDMTYTGKALKPNITIDLGKTLKKGTDFTVKYKNNKKVGKATVTIKGKGSYTGTITKTFKIIPNKTKIKKLTSPKSKQLKVTYKKVSGVTGYQVTYSTSEKFTKADTKSATVKGASKLSKTVKSLSKGKTYYVKVRAYKTVSGKKYYSGYTAAKKITVK